MKRRLRGFRARGAMAQRGGRRHYAVALGALVIGLVTAIAIGLEAVRPLGGAAPGARAAIETTISVSAILSAGLLVADFRRSRRIRDLVLLCVLISVFVSDFEYLAVPALWGLGGNEARGDAQLACDLVIAAAIAAAAFGSRQRIRNARRGLVIVAGAVGVALVTVTPLLTLIGGSHWAASALRATGIPGAGDHSIAVAAQITSSLVMLVAGVVLVARGRRGDVSAAVLGAVAFLIAGVRLQYLTMPVVPTDWVTPREGLRLGAYALILALAYRPYAKARHGEAYAVLSAERERIARDLHDGLAQDLAYITSQGQRLGVELGPDHPVMIAARRALAGVRGAIADLTASEAPSAEAALRTIASELGRRFGLQVDVVVYADGSPATTDDAARAEREHLVRIAREAIVNAALHGAARHVEVLFEHRGANIRMRISDDGCGVADVDRVGFGLRTMRARARSLGGELSMRPGEEGGTVLELLVRDRRVPRTARRGADRSPPMVPSLAGATYAPGTSRGPVHARFPLSGRRKQFQRHGA